MYICMLYIWRSSWAVYIGREQTEWYGMIYTISMVWYGWVVLGTVWYGMVGYGNVRYDTVWYGRSGYCMRHGRLWYVSLSYDLSSVSTPHCLLYKDLQNKKDTNQKNGKCNPSIFSITFLSAITAKKPWQPTQIQNRTLSRDDFEIKQSFPKKQVLGPPGGLYVYVLLVFQ